MMNTLRLRRAGLAAVALAAAAAAACTDVTTQPRSDINAANVFNDTTAYRALLARVYAGLALSSGRGNDQTDIQGIDAGFGQYLRVLWNVQELPTDEAVLAWNDQSAGVQELNTQQFTPSNGSLTALYARILLQATFANELLRQSTEAQLAARGASAALRTQVATYRAEARFLRALSYWHGLDLFGSMPLLTEDSPIGGAAPAPATRQQLFDFVVSELQDLRAALPASAAPNTAAGAGVYGRATQAAADLLLAKVLMNAQVYTGAGRYADALAAAQRVISGGGYALDDNYQDMFLADNNTSPEIVFAVTQDGARTQSFGGTTYLVHASYGNDAGGLQALRDFGHNGGWYGLRARRELGDLFANLAGDERGAVQTGEDAIVFAEGQSPTLTRLVDNFNEGYRIHKYRNVTKAGVGGSDQTFADVDYPMLRLADAYLLAAEALLRTNGSRATALGYVNLLRARAGAPAATDAQLTLDFILDERARELFWEGHRRTDLIRYGYFTGGGKLWQFKGGAAAGAATPAERNLYPIPSAELAANPNLVQNPGY